MIKRLITLSIALLLSVNISKADEAPFQLAEEVSAPVDFSQLDGNEIIALSGSGLQGILFNNIPSNVASLEYDPSSIECLGGAIIEIGFQNPTPVVDGSAAPSFVLPSFPDKTTYTGNLIFKSLDANGNDLNQNINLKFSVEDNAAKICPAVVRPVCTQISIDTCSPLSEDNPATVLLSSNNSCLAFDTSTIIRSGDCNENDVPRSSETVTASANSQAIFLEARTINELTLTDLPRTIAKRNGKKRKVKKAQLEAREDIDPTLLSIEAPQISKLIKQDDESANANFKVSVGDGPTAKVLYVEFLKKGKTFKNLSLDIPFIVSRFSDTGCPEDGPAVCGEILLDSCLNDKDCPINFVQQPRVTQFFTNECEANRFGATIVDIGSCPITTSDEEAI